MLSGHLKKGGFSPITSEDSGLWQRHSGCGEYEWLDQKSNWTFSFIEAPYSLCATVASVSTGETGFRVLPLKAQNHDLRNDRIWLVQFRRGHRLA